MVILTISIASKPDKRSELLSALRQLSETTRRVAGCRVYRIYQEIADPNLFSIEKIWEQRSDLDAHFCSDIFSALLGAVKLLGESYEVRITEAKHTEGMDAVEKVWSKKCK